MENADSIIRRLAHHTHGSRYLPLHRERCRQASNSGINRRRALKGEHDQQRENVQSQGCGHADETWPRLEWGGVGGWGGGVNGGEGVNGSHAEKTRTRLGRGGVGWGVN